MLQSRVLCTDPMQALSQQSFTIRLNVRGWGPQQPALNPKSHKTTFTPAEETLLFFPLPGIHSWDKIPFQMNSIVEAHCIMTLPASSIILEHLVCGICRRSVLMHQPGCTINPKGGVATHHRGWDIYLFFFCRGHLMLRANDVARTCTPTNLPMRWVLEPGWLCRIGSGQLAVALFELEAPREAKNRSCEIIHQWGLWRFVGLFFLTVTALSSFCSGSMTGNNERTVAQPMGVCQGHLNKWMHNDTIWIKIKHLIM